MEFSFSDDNIKQISEILGHNADKIGNSWSWQLTNSDSGQQLVVTLSNDVSLGKGRNGALVSVQSHHGYYELHECMGFVIFEPDEVIFVNCNGGLVSSLIVGKGSTCSCYSNVSRDILSADFSSLDPAVLLSAMQLSLTESILPDIS